MTREESLEFLDLVIEQIENADLNEIGKMREVYNQENIILGQRCHQEERKKLY